MSRSRKGRTASPVRELPKYIQRRITAIFRQEGYGVGDPKHGFTIYRVPTTNAVPLRTCELRYRSIDGRMTIWDLLDVNTPKREG